MPVPSDATLTDINEVPVLPVRGSVLFPRAIMPLNVGRPASVEALRHVDPDDPLIAIVGQRNAGDEDPDFDDLYPVGTLARIHRKAEVPRDEGSLLLVMVEGVSRIRIHPTQRKGWMRARVETLEDEPPALPGRQFEALVANVRTLFREIVEESPSLPDEMLPMEAAIEDPGYLADWVAGVVPLDVESKQQLLEMLDVERRLSILVDALVRVREDLKLQHKIRNDVAERISDSQRKMMLREQLEAIQRELGEGGEGGAAQELKDKLAKAELPEEARKVADRELQRLEGMPPQSAEYPMARTYLEWLAELPWGVSGEAEVDLERAQEVLDEDHYDLERVKERILEHLAVYRLKQDLKGPILCLVGPPGTGKTSVGRSVARAMGREFGRISLGGMHDEAEIRGHRRTYVGSRPGQILHAIKRAGTQDPVIMLDEVDKIGRDFRGDPSAALLEVLDPEQNHSFRDHYLEVPFDLSKVLFITTANVLDPIPPPLLDRMEVIELSGYIDAEKLRIAERYLIPRQIERNGLMPEQIAFTEDGIRALIHGYTREAGVRQLEQKIASVCRKRARNVVNNGHDQLRVDAAMVRELMGVERYKPEGEIAERTARPGVGVALAWTPAGGEVLFVEASRMPDGKGSFKITGQVREVMQESANAALTWVRAHADELGVDPTCFKNTDIHLHVPSGAVPKDGPSAGVVMAVALLSSLTGRPVRPKVALSGEISLSGLILPVGGVREKVLAAHRLGIEEVVLPEANRADFEEIPADLLQGLKVTFVSSLPEALERAFPQRATWAASRPAA